MTNRNNILSTLGSNRNYLARYGIREVGLFCSYARNEQSPGSDLDVLIDFEHDHENYDNYMAVCDILEQLFSNEKVNIVARNGLSPHIGPRILKEVMYV